MSTFDLLKPSPGLKVLVTGGAAGIGATIDLEALDATGQRERAQQIRWTAFEERLSVNRLRAYLKALPDFDDVLAEEKAMAYALAFPGFTSALHFFIEWPNLPHAARLILSRPGEIGGHYYSTLLRGSPHAAGADP